MTSTPPTDVIRYLRQEVGFGCPFPNCRSPILTWHHFDPPWRLEQHHRPDGMIALCRLHADAADGGLFSNTQLKQWKKARNSIDSVKAKFPWAQRNFLIRLGGNYSGGESVPLALAGEPIISLTRDLTGPLLLSMSLRLPDGTLVASIDENSFTADPTQIYDLVVNTAPTAVKIWLSQRDVGMDLSFRRITLQELNEVLAQDRQRARKKVEELISPEMKRFLSANPMLSGGENGDLNGPFIRSYAESQLDDEERVAFLDFKKLRVHSNGRELVVSDGIGSTFFYCASFGNARGFSL